MDVREKLVELLTDNLPRIGSLPKCDNPLQYTVDEVVERIADHLIVNGVTVQEGVSIEDRLHEKEQSFDADVAPVRHGRWMNANSRPKTYRRRCTACGGLAYFCGIGCSYKYCPNCGAMMYGELW